jgi:hypothetical protein
MNQERDSLPIYYSWWKVPAFLALLLVNALALVIWPDLETRWLSHLLAIAGYAIFLGCAAFVVHIVARRGRAVEVRDGRLVYGFWRRYDDPFSQIADVSLKTYSTNQFNLIGIHVLRWNSKKVRLLGSLMKGRPSRNVVLLRAALGLPYEPEEDVFEKGEPWP